MLERTSAYIEIHRNAGANVTVLITATSKVVYKLMGEHYILLDFMLPNAVCFSVGDYIVDAVFGKFVINNETIPVFDSNTGGYKYSLTFVADYLMLANYKHAFCSEGTRKNIVWSLTANLRTHLDAWLNNLKAIGYTDYSYEIDTANVDEKLVRYINFQAVDLISVLNTFCEYDNYNCEWWFDGHVLKIGKCERIADPVEIEEGVNIQSMTVNRSEQEYYNRIYAYGSDANLSSNYRRTLSQTATSSFTYNSKTYWYGREKNQLTQAMFPKCKTYELTMPLFSVSTFAQTNVFKGAETTVSETGTYNIELPKIEFKLPTLFFDESNTSPVTAKVLIQLSRKRPSGQTSDVTIFSKTVNYLTGSVTIGSTEIFTILNASKAVSIDSGDKCSIKVSVSFDLGSRNVSKVRSGEYYASYDNNVVSVAPTTACASYPVKAKFGNADCYIVINPLQRPSYNEDYSSVPQYFAFMFSDVNGNYTTAPTGFKVGSELTLITDERSEVPYTCYTSVFEDPSNTLKVGAIRLQLPQTSCPNGYYQPNGSLSKESIREHAILFEDIYPSRLLRVDSVEEKNKTEEVDGIPYSWTQYILKLKNTDGTTFEFARKYLLQDKELEMRFLSPSDVNDSEVSDGYKLTGMTFKCSYNSLNKTFTLIRNEDFGAKLPNADLKPNINDGVELIGVDVRAFSTGAETSAETRLFNKVKEYYDALTEGQFTLQCKMSPQFLMDLVDITPLYDSEGKELWSTEDLSQLLYARLYCKDVDDDLYAIPELGAKVKVKSGALTGGYKITRIIGYEMKLDKPYDHPQFTIGDTDAYSRLRNIEKQITNIS